MVLLAEHTKEVLIEQITTLLDYEYRDWSDFLVADCQEFVANLHSYRLEHLLMNQGDFIAYIESLQTEYLTMVDDETLAPQAQATIQAFFLLSCVEFASASKERMLIREMEGVKK